MFGISHHDSDDKLTWQKATLQSAFPERKIPPSSHPDVPSPSNLKILEPTGINTGVSLRDIQSFLWPKLSVWDKNYSPGLNTWEPSANTFGMNYASSAKLHDPAPLETFLKKFGDGSSMRQQRVSEGSDSRGTQSRPRLPTDQDLDGLAKQLERKILTCLGNEPNAS